jgi:hypothetical protein
VVQHLLSKCKALSSIPGTLERMKEEKKERKKERKK